MNKLLKLVYWHTTVDNYGDLLSPYIIGNLSGRKVIQKNYFVGNWKSHLYHFYHSILNGDWRLKNEYQFPCEKTIIGIGSILAMGNHRSKIWGAGFMSQSEKCKGGRVYALRGKKSLSKILAQIENGDNIKLSKDYALGDPAMLLPLLIPANSVKKYDVGIIPHFSETNYFKRTFGDRFHVIDLQSDDIDKVTSEITACRYVLSSSLHGIIVAHSYNIPALWIEYSGLEKNTNGFKFKDYLSSVEIPSYNPITNLSDILKDINSVEFYFHKYENESIPHIDISKIQNDLLRVAPFSIRL